MWYRDPGWDLNRTPTATEVSVQPAKATRLGKLTLATMTWRSTERPGHTITMFRLLTKTDAINGIAASLVAVTALVACNGDDNASGDFDTQVTINELQSQNSTIESDTDKKSDWVELYNPSNTDEDLAGFFISDDRDERRQAALGVDVIVPANGFLVLWLDGTNDARTPLHFPFKLSGDGDNFFLNDPTGRVLRSVTIPPDPTGDDVDAADVSYGALPDGSDTYNWCQTPTPGQPNSTNCVAADVGS